MRRSIPPRPLLVLLALLLGVPVLASCTGKSVSTQVIPIAHALPATQEQTRYRLVDAKGNDLGSATLSIAPEDQNLRLGVAYDFGANRTDTGSALVQRDSMRPVQSERTVVDGSQRYVTHADYSDDSVTVTVNDGQSTRTRKATITEASYDNLESLFLWRTLDFSVGTEVHYVNVVIDPRRGTISRTLATAEVMGQEQVQLPSGSLQAWRIEFRSAGITNTAWYRADEPRTLVRYEITHGPTLVLDASAP